MSVRNTRAIRRIVLAVTLVIGIGLLVLAAIDMRAGENGLRWSLPAVMIGSFGTIAMTVLHRHDRRRQASNVRDDVPS